MITLAQSHSRMQPFPALRCAMQAGVRPEEVAAALEKLKESPADRTPFAALAEVPCSKEGSRTGSQANVTAFSAAAGSWGDSGGSAAADGGTVVSSRLAALRTQLEESSAYVDYRQLDELRILGKGAFATVTKCK